MSAVAEKPKHVEPQACKHLHTDEQHLCVECGGYVMPKVTQGEDVTYYDPTLAEGRKVTGFVMKINRTGRTITVHVPSSGGNYDLVRHVSDPKLKESNDHRENGAWDYSDRSRQVERRFADLEKRITELEAALVEPKSKK